MFDESAVPAASQSFSEDGDKAQSVICVPAVGLYVRVSVTASEQASDETLAATIAQLRVNGFYVEGFLDASGVSSAQLARVSGVHEVYISRLKNGRQKNTSCSNADALREAMGKIDPKAAKQALK